LEEDEHKLQEGGVSGKLEVCEPKDSRLRALCKALRRDRVCFRKGRKATITALVPLNFA